jgi:predicted transcriptional regulator of viral defense system
MKGLELLRMLRRIDKPYYTISDLEKVTTLPRSSLYVAIKRWVAAGILQKVAQGIYLPMGKTVPLENIAAQLYFPSYLSFESALAQYGILNLIPYSVTFATTRKTRKYTLNRREIEFRQIAPRLYFGFEMRNGVFVALAEKAFLDEIYFVVRGSTNLDPDEIDLKKMSSKVLRDYSKRFPSNVQDYLKRILPKRA